MRWIAVARSVMRRWAVAAIVPALIVVAVISGDASAGVLSLQPDQDQYLLDTELHVLEDPSGSLDITAVMERYSAGEFVAASRETLPFGLTPSAYWFHLHIDNASDLQKGWLLELSYPLLDSIEFYAQAPDGALKRRITGDRHPISSRDRAHRNFLFELPTPLPEFYSVYLRVQTEGTMSVPATLWSADAFLEKESSQLLRSGWYYGAVLAMVFYNLFLFASIRELGYLYYVLYLSATLLLQLSLQGLTFLYLWPEASYWGNLSVLFFLVLAYYFGTAFTREFLSARRLFPNIDRSLSILAWISLSALLLVFIVPYALSVRLVVGMAVVVCVAILVANILAFRSGYKPAKYTLLAYAILFPCVVTTQLYHLGMIESVFLGSDLFKLGTALDAVLLSFGLAYRITALTEEKARAQSDLLHVRESALMLQQDFSKRLIEYQEGERRRLSAELHDGLGQSMLLMVNKLQRYLQGIRNPSGGEEELKDIIKIASDSVHEAREISHALHPHILDRLGLRKAIESRVNRVLAASGMNFSVRVDDIDGVCPQPFRIHIYRIVQEAVNNIIRHSDADRCGVEISVDDCHIRIRVEDDGIGVGREISEQKQSDVGIGLAGIAERVKIMGGRFFITPADGGGTLLEVAIPTEGHHG